MSTCYLCGDTASRFFFPVPAGDAVLENKEEVMLCELCTSARGFLLGKEYAWRRYGDERPAHTRHDLKTRGGCPHCEIDCTVCPYAEE